MGLTASMFLLVIFIKTIHFWDESQSHLVGTPPSPNTKVERVGKAVNHFIPECIHAFLQYIRKAFQGKIKKVQISDTVDG